MSTIPRPFASILELLVRALTAALEWLAYHRPTIHRAGTIEELVLDRQRLWDALDELDRQGGRVLDIGADISKATRVLELISVESDIDVTRELAKSTLGHLADRRLERRSRPTSPS